MNSMQPQDKKMSRFWAGGFLYNPENKSVFLHLRDNNTSINPNMWAFFGGLNERNETFLDCFIRELHEEIGLLLEKGDVRYLRDYLNTDLDTHRVVFYVERKISEKNLSLGEGAGFAWISLSQLDNYPLTAKTKDDVAYFKKAVGI